MQVYFKYINSLLTLHFLDIYIHTNMVFQNSTDKLKGVIIVTKKMKNNHRTLGCKTRIYVKMPIFYPNSISFDDNIK